MMNKIECFLLSISALLLAGCSSDNVKIKGTIHGKGGSTMYVERLVPKKEIVDSIKLNSNGGFSYNYIPEDTLPSFVNLKMGKSHIPLLVERGESVVLNSIYSISGGYSVEGSKGSSLLREFNRSMRHASNQIDSLYMLFNGANSAANRNFYNTEIGKLYIAQKQENIKFLVQNRFSLATIAVLYQKMPNGIEIFNEQNDVLYFKMVADSLASKYPTSIHVQSLYNDIARKRNRSQFDLMVNKALFDESASTFPDISMKDIYGKMQSLSSLKGKVVLLSFWSYEEPNSSMLNSEYKELYRVYKEQGLEIFQVSVDRSKLGWVEAVVNQKLPWISVSDLQGANSIGVRNYNVNTLPANVVIGRDGKIVARNIFGADLTNVLGKQF